MVIWTIPPGPAELRAALAQIRPQRVCLFAQDPGADRPDAFLRRLAGLAKHALAAKEGRASLDALAAAAAQRRIAVELGLAWLAGQGHIHVSAPAGDEILLAAGDGMPQPPAGRRAAEKQLTLALVETAAYRAFYREAEAAALVPG